MRRAQINSLALGGSVAKQFSEATAKVSTASRPAEGAAKLEVTVKVVISSAGWLEAGMKYRKRCHRSCASSATDLEQHVGFV